MINFIQLHNNIRPKRVLDIGAHIGDFTSTLAKLSSECEFIMVEANPYCEPYLSESNHPYYILALSNFTGTTSLHIEKANHIGTGASMYKENTEWYGDGKYELIETPVNTLDNLNFFADEMIDLVKIDVQGAELDILNGGKKTIKRSKYLLLEVSTLQYNIGAPLMDQVVNKLKEYEFVIEDILDYHKLSDGSIFQLDILFKNSYIY
jgi:FkbM family methyltransferase